jgi:putative membrane protein
MGDRESSGSTEGLVLRKRFRGVTMIDYLTLMLINMTAGLVVLADYVYRGIVAQDRRRWAAGFGITGFIAVSTGLHMSLNWPLPGSHNVLFGEPTVLFGALFLGAALALWKEWELGSVAIYAFFAGAVAVLLGVRIIDLGLTRSPVVAGMGYVLSGGGGMLAWLCCLLHPRVGLRTSQGLRTIGALILLAAAAIWALIGYGAYWEHIESLSDYVPPSMQ